jgi:DNA modification methylase
MNYDEIKAALKPGHLEAFEKAYQASITKDGKFDPSQKGGMGDFIKNNIIKHDISDEAAKHAYDMLPSTMRSAIAKAGAVNQMYAGVDKDGKIWDKNISLTKPYQKIYSHIKEQDITKIIEAKTGKNMDVYSICKEGHPAIMCSVLPVVPILMCTNENDIVMDIFSGSNVVGRMSLLLNRKILTTELSKQYYNIGCKMLENSINDFNKEELKIINQITYGEENLELVAA